MRSFVVTDGAVRLSPIVCASAERTAMATLEEFIQPHRRGTLTLSTILWPAGLCRAVPREETLFINEDVDFFGRCLLAGFHISSRPVGMMYIRQHGGERASTNPGRQGVLAPALYRLKWAGLLATHAGRATVATDGADAAPRPCLPRMVRHPLLRDATAAPSAQASAGAGRPHLGGPRALKTLLARIAPLRRDDEAVRSRFHAPVTAGDREDAAIIGAAIER